MNKTALLDWLVSRNEGWEALLAEVGTDRMEIRGVNEDWTFKDLVAHMAGWQPRFNARFLAAIHGQSQPPDPWPVDSSDDDAVNAWIYESYRNRPLGEVLALSRRVIAELIAAVESLPDDVRIETLEDRFHLVWLGEQRFHVGEFFDHFYDDHEPDVRAWLKSSS